MKQEPVLSVTGMRRPQITDVDMVLFRSPVRRMTLARTLAEKGGTKAEV